MSVQKLCPGSSPCWSPDGKYILFEERGGIWIVDVTTRNRRELCHPGSNPSWSPDERQIAFSHEGIWVWERETESGTRVSDGGDHPCWSPLGDSIAFAHQGGIWLMRQDGSEKRKLYDQGIPLSFSPDGISLLIEMWQPGALRFSLAILNIQTRDLQYLQQGTKGSFAPDGYSIVYSHDGIRIFSLVQRDSAVIILEGYNPAWSPAGDRIAFAARGSIWLVDSPYRAAKKKKEG